MPTSRLKKIEMRISLSIMVLVVTLISGFFIFGPDLINVANALSSNYSKAVNDSLTNTIWNTLPQDFLALTGDFPMQGNLNMGSRLITNLANPVGNNDAVNLVTLNNRLGGNRKVVCGQTDPASTPWAGYGTAPFVTLQVDVNTTSAGFTSEPVYVANLAGAGDHYRTYGAQSIYNATASGFRVYVTRLNQASLPGDPVLYEVWSPAQAQGQQWHIHWCGYGN